MASEKGIPKPPTTWGGKIAWSMQVGWLLIATAFESLFTQFPTIDSVQFTVLILGGTGMIVLSFTFSYLVFKEKNRTYLAALDKVPKPPVEPT